MTLDIVPFQRIITKQGNCLTPLPLVPEDSSSGRPTSPQLRKAWRFLDARREVARPLNTIFVESVLEQTHDDAEEIVLQQTAILERIQAGVYGPEHREQVEAEWQHLRQKGKAKKRRRTDQLRALLEADAVEVEKEEQEEEVAAQAIEPASLPPAPPIYPAPKAPACYPSFKCPLRPLVHVQAPVELTLRHPRGSPRKLCPTATLRRRQLRLAEKLGVSSCGEPCQRVYDRHYEKEMRALSKKKRKETEEAAARAIQIRWKYYRLRTHLLLINATLTCAAEVIQCWWRALLNRRNSPIVQTMLAMVYTRVESSAKISSRRVSCDILAAVYSSCAKGA